MAVQVFGQIVANLVLVLWGILFLKNNSSQRNLTRTNIENSRSHSHIYKTKAIFAMLLKGNVIQQFLQTQWFEYILTDTPFLKIRDSFFL